jgi:hypothetical protein
MSLESSDQRKFLLLPHDMTRTIARCTLQPTRGSLRGAILHHELRVNPVSTTLSSYVRTRAHP